MRAILILALLAVICWATLFRDPGGDPPVGAEVPVAAVEEAGGAGFLMDPSPAEQPPAAVDSSHPEAEPEQAPSDGLEVDPWQDTFAADEFVDEGRLAGALLHLDPGGFAEVLRRDGAALPADRRSLYLAFSDALAGRRQPALDRARGLEDSEVLDAREWTLLRAALGLEDSGVVEASVRREPPMAKAMRLALTEVHADDALSEQDWGRAARLLSDLLTEEIDAPWEANRAAIEAWGESVAKVQARRRFSPDGEWPSVEVVVQGGDSLTGIRKRMLQRYPTLTLCTGLIDRVNQLGGRYLQEGQRLRIPTDPVRSVVDLPSRTLLVLFGEEVAVVYPCGIGAEHSTTITGEFTVGTKQKEPMWFPQGREPVPFSDPANPLGTRWLGWQRNGAKTGYGFHGTKDPDSIGKAASEGCIRLHNADVEVLYEILPSGSHVLVMP